MKEEEEDKEGAKEGDKDGKKEGNGVCTRGGDLLFVSYVCNIACIGVVRAHGERETRGERRERLAAGAACVGPPDVCSLPCFRAMWTEKEGSKEDEEDDDEKDKKEEAAEAGAEGDAQKVVFVTWTLLKPSTFTTIQSERTSTD